MRVIGHLYTNKLKTEITFFFENIEEEKNHLKFSNSIINSK